MTGSLPFMLSAGLTLTFPMIGVLDFAHASCYVLRAYFGYQISKMLSFAFGYDLGFCFGPVVGAMVFTLLQTVLSLHTNLRQLYAGVLSQASFRSCSLDI